MVQEQIPFDGTVVDADFEDREKIAGDTNAAEEQINQEFLADTDAVTWKINVAKINDKSKDREHCFYCTPEDFPIADRLRDEHGDGVYKALVYKNGKLHRNLTYRIAARIQAPIAQTSQINDIAAMIQRNNEQMASIIQTGQPGAPSDPVTMMTAMMQAMVQMKEFMAPPPPQNDFKNFLELLAVAKDMTGDAATGKGLMDVMGDLINSPLAKEVADQFANQRQLPGPQKVSGPESQTAINLQVESGPPNQDGLSVEVPEPLRFLDENGLNRLRQQVAYWVVRAKTNKDPSLYAELAMDDYPHEFMQQILMRDDVFEILEYLNNESVEHREWFVEFMEAINHILTDRPETAQDAGHVSDGAVPTSPDDLDGNTIGSGGRAGDAGNNAGAGETRKSQPRDKTKSGGAGKKPAAKKLAGGNKSTS